MPRRCPTVLSASRQSCSHDALGEERRRPTQESLGPACRSDQRARHPRERSEPLPTKWLDADDVAEHESERGIACVAYDSCPGAPLRSRLRRDTSGVALRVAPVAALLRSPESGVRHCNAEVARRRIDPPLNTGRVQSLAYARWLATRADSPRSRESAPGAACRSSLASSSCPASSALLQLGARPFTRAELSGDPTGTRGRSR